MSALTQQQPSSQKVDTLRYWSALIGIAAGHGLAIVLGCTLAGLAPAAIAGGTPGFIMAEMLLVATLLWPATGLAIRSLHRRRSPGWMALPAVLLAALALMMTAFGRPFALPEKAELLHLVPLLLIVLVSACMIVEGLGLGRRSAPTQTAPVTGEMPLPA